MEIANDAANPDNGKNEQNDHKDEKQMHDVLDVSEHMERCCSTPNTASQPTGVNNNDRPFEIEQQFFWGSTP